jgi:hypothetical protein
MLNSNVRTEVAAPFSAPAISDVASRYLAMTAYHRAPRRTGRTAQASRPLIREAHVAHDPTNDIWDRLGDFA